MHSKPTQDPTSIMTNRRTLLSRSAALFGAASSGLLLPRPSFAQPARRSRSGSCCPTPAPSRSSASRSRTACAWRIDEKGGKLGGREIEWFKVDDESEPSKGVENANKLVQRDKVDVLVGTVHSGVQMGIQKVARDSGVLSLIPNAGVHAATRALCAPNVFRTSFTNSQPTLALGKAMVDKGHKKAVWITWKYAAGDEAFEGFRDSYTKAGGTIVKELGLPFPNVEFQALLTEIAVAQARCGGLLLRRRRRRQVHPGLRSGRPEGQDPAVRLGLPDRRRARRRRPRRRRHHHHDALRDSLDTPRNKQFRADYAKAFKPQPDVYAVQGYDTGLLLVQGADAVKGDLRQQAGAVQGHGDRDHRQPARQVDHEQVAQPGPGHLPARRREQGKQGDRHGRQGAGRLRRRLQDGTERFQASLPSIDSRLPPCWGHRQRTGKAGSAASAGICSCSCARRWTSPTS